MVLAAYGYVAARGSGSVYLKALACNVKRMVGARLKALACNVKRMVGARLIEMDETLARPAALATVPADA